MKYASRRTVRREYRLQRTAFAGFLALVAAAALGLLGDRAAIVAHTAAIYLMLLLIFRLAGRRTLSDATTFDLVLLLIIGETTQQAMTGDDDTVLGAAVAIVSLVSLDMTISYLKKWPAIDYIVEGKPILLVRDGQLQRPALDANGLDETDLLEAARLSHGLVAMEDVRQATLERDGKISIVPWRRTRE